MTQWDPAYVWFEMRDTRKVVPKRDKRRKRMFPHELKTGETYDRLPRELHCVRFASEAGTRATVCGILTMRSPLTFTQAKNRQPHLGLYTCPTRAAPPRCQICNLAVKRWEKHGGAPIERELSGVTLPVSWSHICVLSPLALRVLNGAAALLEHDSAWSVPIELYPDLLTEGIVAAEAMRI